jgi:hypothetical protein
MHILYGGNEVHSPWTLLNGHCDSLGPKSVTGASRALSQARCQGAAKIVRSRQRLLNNRRNLRLSPTTRNRERTGVGQSRSHGTASPRVFVPFQTVTNANRGASSAKNSSIPTFHSRKDSVGEWRKPKSESTVSGSGSDEGATHMDVAVGQPPLLNQQIGRSCDALSPSARSSSPAEDLRHLVGLRDSVSIFAGIWSTTDPKPSIRFVL